MSTPIKKSSPSRKGPDTDESEVDSPVKVGNSSVGTSFCAILGALPTPVREALTGLQPIPITPLERTQYKGDYTDWEMMEVLRGLTRALYVPSKGRRVRSDRMEALIKHWFGDVSRYCGRSHSDFVWELEFGRGLDALWKVKPRFGSKVARLLFHLSANTYRV